MLDWYLVVNFQLAEVDLDLPVGFGLGCQVAPLARVSQDWVHWRRLEMPPTVKPACSEGSHLFSRMLLRAGLEGPEIPEVGPAEERQGPVMEAVDHHQQEQQMQD